MCCCFLLPLENDKQIGNESGHLPFDLDECVKMVYDFELFNKCIHIYLWYFKSIVHILQASLKYLWFDSSIGCSNEMTFHWLNLFEREIAWCRSHLKERLPFRSYDPSNNRVYLIWFDCKCCCCCCFFMFVFFFEWIEIVICLMDSYWYLTRAVQIHCFFLLLKCWMSFKQLLFFCLFAKFRELISIVRF